jgi:hypothetical protein
LYLGSVENVEEDYFLKLEDGTLKKIDTNNLPEFFLAIFSDSEKVRIMGTTTSDGLIYPCAVMPFDFENKNIFAKTPPPIKSEIKIDQERINNCKSVRPYRRLQLTN